MTSENWLHFSTDAPKRKRAELVCVHCHSKKIKCDLQVRRNRGENDCTNCSTAARDCRVRPSKREKRRKPHREVIVSRTPGTDSRSNHVMDGVETLLAAESNLHALAETAVQQENNSGIDPRLNHNHISPHSLGNVPLDSFQLNASPQDLLSAKHNQNRSPLAQCQIDTGHTDTTPTQGGDVDTGFLQVYDLENRYDAENQAMVAQMEHRYSSALYPDLEHIFTETYFTYCYPWCPVLDRDTLSSEIARSPLLANALALASSHIQPPLLPHDGPDLYYKRARKIFYEDEEADTITTLKAICLFYWWAPQSPSRVHRNSSWWWTSVVIRHAQQMNLHREPSVDDANRLRLNLSLRRKIWWTAFVSAALLPRFEY